MVVEKWSQAPNQEPGRLTDKYGFITVLLMEGLALVGMSELPRKTTSDDKCFNVGSSHRPKIKHC